MVSKAIRVMSSDSIVAEDEDEENVDDPSSTAAARPAAGPPTIRVRNNLHSCNGSGFNQPVRLPESLYLRNPGASARPYISEAEAEVKLLKEEVKALQWLSRRKEQEWDQVLRLLKQKEEKLLKAERARAVAAAEAGEAAKTIVKVLPPRVTAAPPSAGVAINGTGAVSVRQGAAGTTIINKQVLTAGVGAAPGGGRRMLIPAGQITIAQLNAMKSSGKINASQLQSIAQGKTVPVVKSTPAADQQQSSASGGMLASKFAPIAAKPAAAGPKILTVRGSAAAPAASAAKRVSAAVATDPQRAPVGGGVGNGGSAAAAKPSSGQIRDSSQEGEAAAASGKITVSSSSSSSVPLCGNCRTRKSRFVCSYCKDKWYCSRQCQLADWDAHEDECADGE